MKSQAFSLVEISIVLVILGLLTGGILTGQSLIRAAELKSIPRELQVYQSAVLMFRDKYFAIPGDMANATDFWGAASSCSAALTDEGTCNGNGDGIASSFGEGFRAWHHLSRSGLVKGSYTGISGVSGSDTSRVGVPGQNIPGSKLEGGGWFWMYPGPMFRAVDGRYFSGDYGHTWHYASGQALDEGTSITGEEGWSIDKKVDDGRPGTGKVRTYNNTHRPYCADSNDPEEAQYYFGDLEDSRKGCYFLIDAGF